MNQLWSPLLERCGFILKDGTIIEVENKHPTPSISFSIETESFETYADQIAIVWHTHPTGFVNLSVADYHAFLLKPEYLHMIIGKTQRAIFQVEDGVVLIREFYNGDA